MKIRPGFFLVMLLTLSCKKHHTPAPEIPAPPKAVLLFPAQSSACVNADFFSASQSHVSFRWDAPAEAQSFSLIIKNLKSRDSLVENTYFLQDILTLNRGNAYSWYIISRSSKTGKTTLSDVWRFYNPANGETSYAPFPAQLIAPFFGQKVNAATGTVDLSWAGDDADHDISSFDVYFGTYENPPLLQEKITDTFLRNIPVTSGTTYYWKIITKDAKGNRSDSDHFQFYVN